MLEIIPDSDPRLHTAIPEYDFAVQTPEDRAALVVAMSMTLDTMDAVGLAANQCGLMHRLFVIREDGGETTVCFNPSATTSGTSAAVNETTVAIEGCLSFPELWLKIERPYMIDARWQDVTGTEVRRTLHGYHARAFLHELDHLNGIVFTSKVSKLALEMAKKKRAKTQR